MAEGVLPRQKGWSLASWVAANERLITKPLEGRFLPRGRHRAMSRVGLFVLTVRLVFLA